MLSLHKPDSSCECVQSEGRLVSRFAPALQTEAGSPAGANLAWLKTTALDARNAVRSAAAPA